MASRFQSLFPSLPIPSHPVPSHPVPSHPFPSRPVPSRPVPSRPVPSHPIPSRPCPYPIPIPSRPIPSRPCPGTLSFEEFQFACLERWKLGLGAGADASSAPVEKAGDLTAKLRQMFDALHAASREDFSPQQGDALAKV